jgi:mono/diheme cytochrome c family protein
MKKSSLALATLLLALGASVTFAAPASEIWTNQCAKCHGADGAGKTVIGKKLKLKDYSDAAVQAAIKDEDMVKAIKTGVKDEAGKDRMKAFADLTDADVSALVAYIRTFKK